MHACPDVNIICRNIDMYALTDIACPAGPVADTSSAPSRWRVPVSRWTPRGSPFAFSRFHYLVHGIAHVADACLRLPIAPPA
ncbi:MULTISPECIES: hypothetical protein [Burkholderia]|uniref:hypothetical protein n=1 Tax=Burkholderia TaxID=32008 RepID=UPI0012BC789B|nr:MULTISPECIES: hypothetical protein [Burkholderia]